MADYQSILTIKVQHEYYNSYKDELAPFDIVPDQKTESLFKQYSMLVKPKPGCIQLIVDSSLFSDLAALTQEFILTFYLVSTDPVARSITKKPNMFDIANLHAEFTQDPVLNITADNWISSSQLNESAENNDMAGYNKNLISILNILIPRRLFTLERKCIIIRFNTISTRWKYYIFSLNIKKNLSISSSSGEAHGFTEQAHEQVAGKMARIFLSNDEIPLRKAYTEFHSLLNDNKVAVKSLPFPDPQSISILLIDGSQHLTSHIYVSGH